MGIDVMLSELGVGFLRTLAIFGWTLLLSLPFGLVVCAGRRSKIRIIKGITKIYIAIMRGTPLMLQLLVWYFAPYYLFGARLAPAYRFIAIVLGFSLNYAAYFAEIQNTPVLLQMCFLYYALAFSGHSLGIIATGFLALGIYTGAYMAEVIRTGIESVPKGQFEAARVLVYTKKQRYMKIILPQVVKRVLPAITNEVITLVKDTSLAYALSYSELFALTKQIAAAQTSFLPFVIAGIFYFVFNAIVAFVMERIEKKYSYYS